MACDITDDAAVRAAVEAVVVQFGELDIVVNNAGIGATGDIAANDDDEWHRVLDVNVVGIARVTRAALPYLRASSRAADRQHLARWSPSVGRPAPRAVLGEQGRGRRR